MACMFCICACTRVARSSLLGQAAERLTLTPMPPLPPQVGARVLAKASPEEKVGVFAYTPEGRLQVGGWGPARSRACARASPGEVDPAPALPLTPLLLAQPPPPQCLEYIGAGPSPPSPHCLTPPPRPHNPPPHSASSTRSSTPRRPQAGPSPFRLPCQPFPPPPHSAWSTRSSTPRRRPPSTPQRACSTTTGDRSGRGVGTRAGDRARARACWRWRLSTGAARPRRARASRLLLS